jgi:hypothetical protein
MLDRLPPMWRHLVLIILTATLGWLASDVVPALDGHTGYAGVAGVVLTALVAILTPFTRAYGVGFRDGDTPGD